MTFASLLVFTGTRADYGIMRPLLALLADEAIETSLLVSGTHLSPQHGMTADEIERDGHRVQARIPVLDDSMQDAGTSPLAHSIGVGVQRYADELRARRPSIALVLGDRFEAFAFAVACHIERIPVAHLHGGEVTAGAIDDGFRHSISKFASLHLVASEEFRQRLLRLGEHPATVHTVGALGLDSLRAELEHLPATADRQQILLAYHPATAADEPPAATIERLVTAARETGRPILATGPNADPGGDEIRAVLQRHADSGHLDFVESLGSVLFVRSLNTSAVMIGNSSAGIIEAPFAGVATVNVGVRQLGRPRASSVLDSDADAPNLSALIERAAATRPPRLGDTPYGNGHASVAALHALLDPSAWAAPTKHFYDGAGGMNGAAA